MKEDASIISEVGNEGNGIPAGTILEILPASINTEAPVKIVSAASAVTNVPP